MWVDYGQNEVSMLLDAQRGINNYGRPSRRFEIALLIADGHLEADHERGVLSLTERGHKEAELYRTGRLQLEA